MRVIRETYKPMPEISLMEYIYDIREWLGPMMKGLHNIVYPHCFKIVKSNGVVSMKYKNWANDKECLPLDETLKVLNRKTPTFKSHRSLCQWTKIAKTLHAWRTILGSTTEDLVFSRANWKRSGVTCWISRVSCTNTKVKLNGDFRNCWKRPTKRTSPSIPRSLE